MSNTIVAIKEESISLYFSDGHSDKEYHIQLEASGEGYKVNFQYGRRGSTLQTGTKTSKPLPREQAKKIYQKLVQEKRGKGYSPGNEGIPYQGTDLESLTTGVSPQLLNPIKESDLQTYLENNDFVMQEKFDGRRVLLHRTPDGIVGINRRGLAISLPESLTRFPEFRGMFLLDGESIGDSFYAFDLLEADGKSKKEFPYWERLKMLQTLIAQLRNPKIISVRTFEGKQDKSSAFEMLRTNQREGVVFKSLSAYYVPGRPASGGNQLKYKFTQSASVVVDGINPSKRSIAIALFEGKKKLPVGNVTIPPNHTIPVIGNIVEIRYLYAFPGGSLFQPVYLGVRDDLDLAACTIAQLKMKGESAE